MRRPKLIVTIGFEPSRVGVQPLIDAYARVVPIIRRPRIWRSAVTTQDLRLATWNYRRAK